MIDDLSSGQAEFLPHGVPLARASILDQARSRSTGHTGRIVTTNSLEGVLEDCVAKMRLDGASEAAIRVFSQYHRFCSQGATGIIREATITPYLNPPRLDEIDIAHDIATDALSKTVMIKLNGGLGTSMGLDAPKTLLPVRDGKNFLDVIVDQVRWARRHHGVRLPLIFMNSFRTQRSTLAHLTRYRDLAVDGLQLDFLQGREPSCSQTHSRPWTGPQTGAWNGARQAMAISTPPCGPRGW